MLKLTITKWRKLLTVCLLILTISVVGSGSLQANDLDQKDNFIFIGLTDLTLGNIDFSQVVLPVEGDENYQDKLFLNGRIAFYLQGKIQGKYLLTAQLDTGDEPISEFYKNIVSGSDGSIFDKLDPDAYYPVYGDSTQKGLISQDQRLYLCLETEKFTFVWGNYQTDFVGDEMTAYHRQFYGAKVNYSMEREKLGGKVQAFLAWPPYIHTRDEFTYTGSILYFLKQNDLILGSERLRLELRNPVTLMVEEIIELKRDQDYQIDWLQGRILLDHRVSELVRDSMESDLYLVAEYDYDPQGQELATMNYGFNYNFVNIPNQISLNGSYIHEKRDGGDGYGLLGFDGRYQISDQVGLSFGMGRSNNLGSDAYLSDNGGLTFQQISTRVIDTPAWAWKGGMTFDGSSWFAFLPKLTGSISYNHGDQGFSSTSKNISTTYDSISTAINGSVSEKNQFNANYLIKKEKTGVESKLFDLTVQQQLLSDLRIEGKVEHSQKKHATKYESKTSSNLAFRYQYSTPLTFYGSQQITLQTTSGKNDETTLGLEFSPNGQISLQLEGRGGTEGLGGSIGADYTYQDHSSVYTRLDYGTTENSGQGTTAVVGTQTQVTDNINAYTEHTIRYSQKEESKGNVYGLQLSPADPLKVTFDYSRALVQSPNIVTTSDDTRRDIVTTGITYQKEKLNGQLRLQYRKDQGAETLQQLLGTGELTWKWNHSLSVMAKTDYSRTIDLATGEDVERLGRVDLGLAYRPAQNDRLNLLGKYTFLDELQPSESENTDDLAEKGHILSLEGIYDLSPRWQITGKTAWKNSAKQVNPVQKEWLSSNTSLNIVRVNYHLIHQWDIFGEYRILRNDLAQDQKNGALVGAYRHLNSHLKLGVGYNFTDFNDDLSRLNYDSRGLFINLISKW